jgi:plasmid stabilization system protein ParE
MSAKKTYKVFWTDEAKFDLKNIYDFYKVKSLKTAKNIIDDIRKSTHSIHFSMQSQTEPYNSKYRRIIVRHYKVLYRVMENELYVFGVVDTRQNPSLIADY